MCKHFLVVQIKMSFMKFRNKEKIQDNISIQNTCAFLMVIQQDLLVNKKIFSIREWINTLN
jgi:hypothetical protein